MTGALCPAKAPLSPGLREETGPERPHSRRDRAPAGIGAVPVSGMALGTGTVTKRWHHQGLVRLCVLTAPVPEGCVERDSGGV